MKIKGLYNMPGSRFYWYRWTQDGIRQAVSLKTDDMSEAMKKIGEIKAGQLVAQWEGKTEAPRTHITKLVEAYLNRAQTRAKKPMRKRTAARRAAALGKFIREAKIATVENINWPVIEKWLSDLKRAGKSAETIHTYSWVLKIFVNDLIDQGILRADVIKKFEIPEHAAVGRRNWLPMKEANRVIAEATDPELKFTLYCGFHAGLRKSEILATRVVWFDLNEGLLHVQNDPGSNFILKDRENRVIPLTDEFKKFLAEYLAGRDPLSYALRPEDNGGKGEYRYDFKNPWKSHMKRCGVKCSIHDARRSFASNLVTRGVSIYKVARWLGDGVAVVEKSYGHLAPADRDVNVLSMA